MYYLRYFWESKDLFNFGQIPWPKKIFNPSTKLCKHVSWTFSFLFMVEVYCVNATFAVNVSRWEMRWDKIQHKFGINQHYHFFFVQFFSLFHTKYIFFFSTSIYVKGNFNGSSAHYIIIPLNAGWCWYHKK